VDEAVKTNLIKWLFTMLDRAEQESPAGTGELRNVIISRAKLHSVMVRLFLKSCWPGAIGSHILKDISFPSLKVER
jgi:hypothetical protein